MKLCDTYSETVINNGKRKFLEVVGDFTCTKVYLILNNGVNLDPKDKIGISHLCEHIFIESVAKKFNEKMRDCNFQSMGYTNYEYTVLTFSISSRKESLECLINILSELINDLSVKCEYVQKCKNDVIRECNVKNKESDYSLKVNSFITDGNINYLPIGDADKIINIEEEDITAFLSEYYSSFSFVIIHNKSVSLDINFESLITKETIFQNSIRTNCCQNMKKTISKVLNINSDYQKNQRIYFNQTKMNYTYKEKVTKCLIEIIINYKICLYLCIENEQYSPIMFKRKIVNEDYSFIVVCIDGYEKKIKGMEELVEYLLNIYISNRDFNQSKDTFISFLNETTDINDTFVFNNIFHYLIYDDILSITENHVNQLGKMINEITLDDIIKLKRDIFTSDYKVVTSY